MLNPQQAAAAVDTDIEPIKLAYKLSQLQDQLRTKS